MKIAAILGIRLLALRHPAFRRAWLCVIPNPPTPMIRGLSVPKDQIDEFCRRWKVSELAVSEKTHSSNDGGLGLFVRFDSSANWSLLDRMRMQQEFNTLSGREVSLQSRHGEAVRRGKSGAMRLIYNS